MEAAESGPGMRRDPRRAKEQPEVPVGTSEGNYPRRMNCATAAQLVGISVSYMRRLTSKGLCPAAIRFGHRVKYDRELLLAWKPDSRG